MALGLTKENPLHLTDLHDDALNVVCETIHATLTRVDLFNFAVTCKSIWQTAKAYVYRHTRTLTDCADGFSRLPSIRPWLSVMDDPKNEDKWVRHARVLKIRMVAMMKGDVSRLAAIIAKMKLLEEVELTSPKAVESNQEQLRRVAVDCGLRKLRRFTTTAGLEDLLSVLDVNGDLIIHNEYTRGVDPSLMEQFAAQGRLENVVNLELDYTSLWRPTLMKAIVDHMPSLRTLGIVSGDSYGYSHSFEEVMASSSPFVQLKHMSVAGVQLLSLQGFRPTCDRHRSECQAPFRFCPPHRQEAFQYAGKLVLSSYPGLELLRFVEERYVQCDDSLNSNRNPRGEYHNGVIMEFRPVTNDGQRTMGSEYRKGTRGTWRRVQD